MKLFNQIDKMNEMRVAKVESTKAQNELSNKREAFVMSVFEEYRNLWSENKDNFETKAKFTEAYLKEYSYEVDSELPSEVTLYNKVEFILSNPNFKTEALQYSDIAKFQKLEGYWSNSKVNKAKESKAITKILNDATKAYETSTLKLNKKVRNTMADMTSDEISKIIEVAKIMQKQVKAREAKIAKAEEKLSKAEFKVWLAELELSEVRQSA